MKSSYILCLLFSAVLGAIYLTYQAVKPVEIAGLSCAANRIVAFGYTDKRVPVAELAAIAKWQQDTEKKKPGFGNWHLSRERAINCQLYKNSAHFQCTVSANPCKLEQPNTG